MSSTKRETPRQRRSKIQGRNIGYARVSKGEQNLSLQLDALKQQGCRKNQVFVDTASGARSKRPGLEACLKNLRAGDVLHVWRLDRLGRSMPHLITVVEELRNRQVGFRSVCDGVIDTTTASGDLVFHIFSALAQFERRLIQERTQAGLQAARARGRHGGRRPIAANDPRVRTAKHLYQNKNLSIAEMCRTLKISRATLYRYLNLEA